MTPASRPHPTSRVHVFVLALCVTGCLAVALYPSRIPADHAVRAVTQLFDSALHRLLLGETGHEPHAAGRRP